MTTSALAWTATGLHFGGRVTPLFLKKSRTQASASSFANVFRISAIAGMQHPYFASSAAMWSLHFCEICAAGGAFLSPPDVIVAMPVARSRMLFVALMCCVASLW